MTPPLARVRLPDGRLWLRVADPAWSDPLDASFARASCGRWNPPGSFPVLYLNADVATARMQVERMLADYPVQPDDLDDDAYVLVAAILPRGQLAADAASDDGLRVIGLPPTYPRGADGLPVSHAECQGIGERVRGEGLRGLWCRSACRPTGEGRELAWFPATARSRARAAWSTPLPLGAWLHVGTWEDLGLPPQADPAPVPS